MDYDLEISKIVEKIKKKSWKKVLLQLPDGLKPKAELIYSEIDSTGCTPIIWFSSCFGSCDIPQNLDHLNIDAVISFGHNQFKKEKW